MPACVEHLQINTLIQLILSYYTAPSGSTMKCDAAIIDYGFVIDTKISGRGAYKCETLVRKL